MSILKRLLASLQKLIDELLRLPMRVSRNIARFFNLKRDPQSGFVLPTVVMVILVVTLLTTAIVIRSTDRSRNASNVRVSQVVLNAALPAIDRAKLKLDAAFEDPTLPRGTPSDRAVNDVLNKDKYTLDDENRLQLTFDLNDSGNIENQATLPLEQQEILRTAWRYPVDTDSNGKYDSFTLYGIYFRSPPRDDTGVAFTRSRQPLDARTPPQASASRSDVCVAALGTSASLVGAEGWDKIEGVLKKSFYIYTATVPITATNQANILANVANPQDYEPYTGNQGFAALEYQQDRVRIPLGNNAIAYEDDLDMFSGTPLRINGRIVVNSNLHAAERPDGLFFYQVSSDESCFYDAENAKMIVGGNVSNDLLGFSRSSSAAADVHLYQGTGTNPNINPEIRPADISTNSTSSEIAYNTQAFEERIKLLVDAVATENRSAYPEDVEDRVQERLNNPNESKNEDTIRREELEVWFRNRTRRVPFEEVPFGDSGVGSFDATNVPLQGANTNYLRPSDDWHNPAAQLNNTLGIQPNNLPATDPDYLRQLDPPEMEERIGDRILVGNNLPSLWFDPNIGDFVGENGKQMISGGNWAETNEPRFRRPRVRQLVDVGLTERDGFWETAAMEQPQNRLDNVGGLRVVTSGGVYLPFNRPTNPANDGQSSKVIWPDSMPVITRPYANPLVFPDWVQKDTNDDGTPDTLIDEDGDGNPDVLEDLNGRNRPFLQMRATAVYHYTNNNDPQGNENITDDTPIACVSSYYDPTNWVSAHNENTSVPNFSGPLAWNEGVTGVPGLPSRPSGASNNGITYRPMARGTEAGYRNLLNYMADLVYPNGRLVNPQLKKALVTPDNDRTLADWGAIDSMLCSLGIWDGSIGGPTETPTSGYQLPHGTIQEVAFLDGREVKNIEGIGDTNTVNLDGTLRWSDRGDPVNRFPTNFQAGNNRNDYYTQPTNVGRSELGTSANARISEYDLAVELRQPLEIRATVLDLDKLRRASTPNDVRDDEWMLPDSGIVYATRDDALPDITNKPSQSDIALALTNNPETPYNESDRAVNLAIHELSRDRLSPTDFWLDPTRRPSGIMLINGSRLGRNGSNQFQEEEKGLILASNLPVYIKAQTPGPNNPGGFNVHDHEEFTNSLDNNTWGNFYERSANQINNQFACRTNDERLPNCTQGDNWRSVAVLSDAITLLSENFRFGFRNEGNYNLRNNQTDNLFRSITAANFPNSNIPVVKNIALDENDDGVLQPSEGDLNGNGILDPAESIAKRRLDNGFWDNPFATNGLSSGNTTGVFGVTNNYTDNSYSTRDNQPLFSSYFNNFVTPVQRRARTPEYLMEMCRKLPVSECLPEDWIVGYNGFDPNMTSDELLAAIADGAITGFNVSNLLSGTTAQSPRNPQDQQYPRRVAFQRQNGTLVVDDQQRPVPLGIDGGGNIQRFSYASGTLPRLRDNSLWFRTMDEIDAAHLDRPTDGNNDNRYDEYFLNRPLFYLEGQGDSGNDDDYPALYGYLDERDRWLNPPFALNSINSLLSSSETVCVTGAGTSSQYLVTTLNSGCSPLSANAAVAALLALGGTTTDLTTTANITIGEGQQTPYDLPNTDLQIYRYNINNPRTLDVGGLDPAETQNFHLVGSNTPGSPITVTLKGNSKSVFILQNNSPTQPILFQNVIIKLDDVNPNNVFWVSQRGMTFSGENQVTGNFLNNTAAGRLIFDAEGKINGGTNPVATDVRGGRFYGFAGAGGNLPNAPGTPFVDPSGVISTSVPAPDPDNPLGQTLTAGVRMTAMGTTRQPLLVPVLQLGRPSSTNAPYPYNGRRPDDDRELHNSYWMPQAPDTRNARQRGEFNLIMATGDSPARYRPNNPSIGEFAGGVSSLVRFLENWSENTATPFPVTIRGSFIQLQRSTYATAPFDQMLTLNNNTSNEGSLFGYFQNYVLNGGRSQPYFPPNRFYGFDVGLLSQLPDLFAQRFTLPPTDEPNEYYREVGRNDDWIQTLLCGVQIDDNGNAQNNQEAVNDEQRPQQCPPRP